MRDTEQLIAVYHTGFIICLCLAILFLVLSIFIFFKFRIRGVFNFLTGRTQKRTIKQMEEDNAQTGKLRQDTYIPEATGDLYRTPSGSIPPVIYPPTGEVASGMEPPEKMNGNGAENTTLLNSGEEETMLLNSDSQIGAEGTAPLYGKRDETMLLTPEMERAIQEERTDKPYSGRFEIIKEKMLVHTEERI